MLGLAGVLEDLLSDLERRRHLRERVNELHLAAQVFAVRRRPCGPRLLEAVRRDPQRGPEVFRHDVPSVLLRTRPEVE